MREVDPRPGTSSQPEEIDPIPLGKSGINTRLLCYEELSDIILSSEPSRPSTSARCGFVRVVEPVEPMPSVDNPQASGGNFEGCWKEQADRDLPYLTVEDLEALLRFPTPITVAPAGEDGPRIQIAHTSRVTLGGVIWTILKHLQSQRRLDLTDEDVHALTQSSSAVLTLEEAIPLMVVTVQVLAGVPSLEKVLRWWEAEVPDTGAPDFTMSAGLVDKLRPLEEFNFWSFEFWALAIDVVTAFIAHQGPISETDFLGQLSDVIELATGLGWQVPIMVATLFVVKRAGWFWELLL